MCKKLKIVICLFLMANYVLKAQDSDALFFSVYTGAGVDAFKYKKSRVPYGTSYDIYSKSIKGNHFQIGMQCAVQPSKMFILGVDANIGLIKNNYKYSSTSSSKMGYSATYNYSFVDQLAYQQISILPQITGSKTVRPYFAFGPFLGFNQLISTKGEVYSESIQHQNSNTIVNDTVYRNNEIKTKYNTELGLAACLGIKIKLEKMMLFIETRANKSFSPYISEPKIAVYHYSVNVGITKEFKLKKTFFDKLE